MQSNVTLKNIHKNNKNNKKTRAQIQRKKEKNHQRTEPKRNEKKYTIHHNIKKKNAKPHKNNGEKMA